MDRPQRASAASASHAWRQPAAPTAVVGSIIGKRIRVFWETDEAWYSGTVRDYTAAVDTHLVVYDDGDQRNETLGDPDLRWELLEEEANTVAPRPSPKPKAQAPPKPRPTKALPAAPSSSPSGEGDTATPSRRTHAADAAWAAAAAEGLTLLREAGTTSGFFGVFRSGTRYKAQVRQGQQSVYLGQFDSSEEAALAIARRFPRLAEQRMAAAAASNAARAQSKMTAEMAVQIAEAEGLTLPVDPSRPCGYRGVHAKPKAGGQRAFTAHVPGQKAARYVGCFATPHEAALAIARELGPAGAAALAQERRNCAGWLMTEVSEMSAPEARRLANEEGLTLRRSHGQPHKLWGVRRSLSVSERWVAEIGVGVAYAGRGIAAADETAFGGGPSSSAGMGGKFPLQGKTFHCNVCGGSKMAPARRCGNPCAEITPAPATDGITHRSLGAVGSKGNLYLGSFSSAEAAALALARRLRDDPELAAHVHDLQQQAIHRAQQQAIRRAAPEGRKRRHAVDDGEEASSAPGARPPSWLLPSDRAAWSDEPRRGERSGSLGDADNGGGDDDENDGEGGEGAVEVQAVEVEVWSDGDDFADGEDATWVDAQVIV